MQKVTKIICALAIVIAVAFQLSDEVAHIVRSSGKASESLLNVPSKRSISSDTNLSYEDALTAADRAWAAYEHGSSIESVISPRPPAFADANKLVREPGMKRRYCEMLRDKISGIEVVFQNELVAIARSRQFSREDVDFLSGNAFRVAMKKVAETHMFLNDFQEQLYSGQVNIDELQRRYPLADGYAFNHAKERLASFDKRVAELVAESNKSGDSSVSETEVRVSLGKFLAAHRKPNKCD